MHSDANRIAGRMKEFGLFILSSAIVDLVFGEPEIEHHHAVTVVRSAHAAEIIIKARIAQEHPLLIFDSMPKQFQDSNKLLDYERLLWEGKTYSYNELPSVLWATTGHKIGNIDAYNKFGKLRNAIMHLGVPKIDLGKTALQFCFTVVEPMVYEFWKTDILQHVEKRNDGALHHFQKALRDAKIKWKPRTE